MIVSLSPAAWLHEPKLDGYRLLRFEEQSKEIKLGLFAQIAKNQRYWISEIVSVFSDYGAEQLRHGTMPLHNLVTRGRAMIEALHRRPSRRHCR